MNALGDSYCAYTAFTVTGRVWPSRRTWSRNASDPTSVVVATLAPDWVPATLMISRSTPLSSTRMTYWVGCGAPVGGVHVNAAHLEISGVPPVWQFTVAGRGTTGTATVRLTVAVGDEVKRA